jgi:hypothetical protein
MIERPKPNDELEWLAFRYVAGELTHEEESRFETRLAGDQAAREAVERAVELKESLFIVATERMPARAWREGLSKQTVLALAAVVAACLLIALGSWFGPAGDDAGAIVDQAPPTDDSSATALALAWAEVHGRPASIETNEAPAAPHSDWIAAEAEGTDIPSGDMELPLWLLRAAEAIALERSEEVQ